MTQEHPITPSDELIEQWLYDGQVESSVTKYIATQAARWGADQELDACCSWVATATVYDITAYLRNARRPKPPSLKGQALSALYDVTSCADDTGEFYQQNIEIIRTALEALPD